MVQIWQMEAYPCGDPRLPHHVFPPKLMTPDELTKRSGTQIWKVRKENPCLRSSGSWETRSRVTLCILFGNEDGKLVSARILN